MLVSIISFPLLLAAIRTLPLIVAFLGVFVAIVGILMSYIYSMKKTQKNDIHHIHARIDDLVADFSDLKERVARAEESIKRIDKKVNHIKTL